MKNTWRDKLYQYRLLIIIVCICLIGGCGYAFYNSFKNKEDSYVTHVSNGDKAIVKTADITVTKDDIYNYLLDNDGSNMTLNTAINYVADKEITDQDAINSKVDELKNQYLQYAGTSDLNTYATDAGYKDEDDFIKQVITPNAKLQLLQEKYVDKNFKSLVKQYKVKYIKYFKDITDETSFTTYFDENSGTDAGMVTKKSSDLDSKIVKKLDKFTKDGIYAKAIKTSESKYAVVWVYNTDKSNLKDEIKKGLTSLSDFTTKCETYYLRKYNFDVYEPSIKKAIKKTSKNYFE